MTGQAMLLQGRAVVVTGAGRGIGRACALAAAEQGASVVVNDVDAEEAQAVAREIAATGGRALAHPADITDWQAAAALVDACVAAYGAIDGMVNNAAVFQAASILDADEASWRRTIEVNVIGSAFCLAHAGRAMARQGCGRIVNVASGGQHGVRDATPYGTSKGAVASMTYCAAIDLDGLGVTVNAVCPRATTRMAHAEAAHARAKGREPLFREMLAAEDNAVLVAYLLSDAAAGFNGQVFRVEDDGFSLVSHPTVLVPRAIVDRRDGAAIATAVEEVLKPLAQPLGIHRAQVRYV